VTSSLATITWNTDEGSNSSVTYWSSPPETIWDNGFVISHSVVISVSANTTYISTILAVILQETATQVMVGSLQLLQVERQSQAALQAEELLVFLTGNALHGLLALME